MPPNKELAAAPSDYNVLTEKFASQDPDIRYMTLVDLGKLLGRTNATFLKREIGICSTIVENLIKLLDDTNGDVQNEAVKCIQPFTIKAPYESLLQFMQKVIDLETSKSQDTTIAATAARTLVLSLPHPVHGVPADKNVTEAYDVISQVLLPKLLPQSSSTRTKSWIELNAPKGVTIEALDLLGEVIRAYGSLFAGEQLQATEQCLMKVLDNDKTGAIAKKRAISSIAKLSIQFTEMGLSSFVSRIVEDLRQSHITVQKRRLLISVIGAISSSTSVKFGKYLQTLAPFVLSAVSQQELDDTIEAISEDNFDPATNDLKEAAFSAIESFVTCCAVDMRPFDGEVVAAAIRYLSYNPSLVGGSDEEMGDGEEEELLSEDEDFEQEEQFNDEDDASWKIRRSACKVLSALIMNRSDFVETEALYEDVLPGLIKAFKDREESVQLEALRAVTSIIRRTVDTIPAQIRPITNGNINGDLTNGTRKRRRVNSTANGITAEELARGYSSPANGAASPTSASRSHLLRQSPILLSTTITLLTSKWLPTRQAAVILLQSFLHLKHDSLMEHLDKVLKPVVEMIVTAQGSTVAQSVSTSSATVGTLRITALHFLGVVFDTHSSTSTSPYLDSIVKAIASAADERNLKVASEALEAGESIIRALTPPRAFGYDKDSKQHIEAMFDLVYSKASANNAEAEVRNRAIQALGVCIARAARSSDSLSTDKHLQGLTLLQDRLAAETTRIAATQAIDLILTTNQADKIDSTWTKTVAVELASHLRKADRIVRTVALEAIKKLTSNPSAATGLDPGSIHLLSTSLMQLYETEGLTHLVLILEILSDLVTLSVGDVETQALNGRICDMVMKPLAGHALDSFLELISSIGKAGAGKDLMGDLLQKVGVSGDPQIVGITIGTLLCAGGESLGVSIDSFVAEVRSKSDDRRVALALIILGEVTSIQGAQSTITPEIFVESLKSRSEEVQSAAAASLGRAAASNTETILPILFTTLQDKSTKSSTALLSIKEFLIQQHRSNTSLGTSSEQLWDRLLASLKEEGARSLAAECMGRLAAAEPTRLFPLLLDHLSNTQPDVRGSIIQAVRFAVSDSDYDSEEALRPYLVKMLFTMLQDKNVENKRMAMATLQFAARSKPRIVLPSSAQLLTHVNKASEIDEALIREVQMGPFKHKVDDGLEMRKAAYETLQAFMDIAYTRMNTSELFDRLLAGLSDDHDVKKLCFMMLTTLIKLDREELALRLDNISECFRAILAIKLKDNAVKQETEKLREIVQEVMVLSIKLRNAYPEIVAASNNSSGQQFRGYLDMLKSERNTQLQTVEEQLKSKQI